MPQPGPGQATTTLLRTAYNALSAAIYRHVAQAAGAGRARDRSPVPPEPRHRLRPVVEGAP